MKRTPYKICLKKCCQTNALLQSKPELLEEWEKIALVDILGRSVVMDGRYIPIESDSFRNALTLNRQ